MTPLSARPLLEGHWTSESGGEGHAIFMAEGIHCANCARSIRRALDDLPGVHRTEVNVAQGRVSVSWGTGRTDLGAILRRVAASGFRPVPLVGEAAAAAQKLERRGALKRIGLAAIGAMQLMMYAAGLWAGALQGIDPKIADYLRWTCLLIATPVLFYSGAPILLGGLRDLRRRVLGMDVTVSLALLLAYGASAFNTVRGTGEVYFDSVAMFILFLLSGRYIEMRGRHQAASITDALARSLPATVQKVDPVTGAVARAPLASVAEGDLLRVASGAVVPVDGSVTDGVALVDESLVTGESAPCRRAAGDALLGGSSNAGATFTMRAARRVDESTLHGLVRLLERAQGERPRLGVAAERMASWFVLRVLVLTALVGIAWLYVDPARAMPAVLAVLVATCPCALSLATPVAIAAATARLAREGVLVVRADAVEGLATVDRVLLDKTGTLTVGRPEVTCAEVTCAEVTCAEVSARASPEPFTRRQALAIAAALERGSPHPIALAFRDHADPAVDCADAHETAGQGVQGTVQGHVWRIGKPAFACALSMAETDDGFGAGVWLASDDGRSAKFEIRDALRPDAADTVRALQQAGLGVRIASGDRPQTVADVAASLGLADAEGGMTPADKLARLRAAQAAGHRVLMVGDGINDGPVLAAADVSMAMGRGSPIAQAAGDLLLLRDSLAALPVAVRVARNALLRVRQNLRWAAGYNLAAIPLAALGFMPPWAAALGMSLSSLLVVFNARRSLDAGAADREHRR
jgi:Cu2+-exporting ATPase